MRRGQQPAQDAATSGALGVRVRPSRSPDFESLFSALVLLPTSHIQLRCLKWTSFVEMVASLYQFVVVGKGPHLHISAFVFRGL